MGALDAKGGVELIHHPLNVDLRREDTKVAGRLGAALGREQRRPGARDPGQHRPDYRTPTHGFGSESL